jgi:hypothetical protein
MFSDPGFQFSGFSFCRFLQYLDRLINTFGFLSFLLWFVLGPGDLRAAPGSPQAHMALADFLGACGPRGMNNIQIHNCCGALFSGPGKVSMDALNTGPKTPGPFAKIGQTAAPNLKIWILENERALSTGDPIDRQPSPHWRLPIELRSSGSAWHFRCQLSGGRTENDHDMASHLGF